jgi:hypothetical protein
MDLIKGVTCLVPHYDVAPEAVLVGNGPDLHGIAGARQVRRSLNQSRVLWNCLCRYRQNAIAFFSGPRRGPQRAERW